jgi:TP901 family phage tail tape measure protein
MAQAGEIRFDAVIDTSGYEKGVKDIQNATDEIKESAEQADKATEDVGKNGGKNAPSIKDAFSKTFDGISDLADGLGLSLPSKLVKVASIGGALAAVGGVFKTGIDSAISQIDVQGTLDAQLGKGSVAAQNAGKVAGELYRQGWGESLEDVANVASNVSSVIRGIGEGDLNTVTKATEVWAQTFDADAGESVRGVKVLMEKFGLSAQDATDLMTKGMQNGLNYTDELADNLSEYGGRWAEAGTSAQEYFSLLQAGVDSGAYQLDKVGDFLNEFLTSLTDGRMEQSIGEFSKGTQDVFNSFKDGKATAEDVLNAVIGEMGAITDKTKEASLASTLWSSLGEDNALGMIEALGNVPNSYENIKGATDEAADSTMSIGQQWEAFKRTMSGTLGDAFTPFVKGFLDGLTDMTKKFTDFVNNTDWSGLANILGSVGSVVVKAFEAVGNSIQPALDLLKAFSDWFSANSTWIVSALVGIGAGFAVFKTAQIISTVVGFLQSFSLAETAATVAQWLFNAAMAANPMVLVITLLAALVAGLVYFFTQTDAGKQAWQDFCQTMQDLWQNLCDFFQNIWDSITKFFTDAGTNITNAWNAVTDWFSGIPGRIKGFFNDIGAWFGSKFQEVKDAIVNRFNEAVGFITGIPGRIRDCFNGAVNWLKDAGGNIVRGLWNGISDMFNWVRNNILGFGGNIVKWAKQALGIHSPSRVMAEEVGKYIPSGIEMGIKANTSGLMDSLDSLSLDMVDAVKVPTTTTGSLPVFDSSASGVTSAMPQTSIVIQSMQVRSDNDIRLIAQELNRLQRRDLKRV